MSPQRVVTVASNKGGVGKTTLAGNLAVYLRALHEDVPVLLLGFDDQELIGRMFALGDAPEGAPTLEDALRTRSLAPAIRLGQYGVHYVPPSPTLFQPGSLLSDPFELRALLAELAWDGIVVIDTKSDLGPLTQNALAASDLTLILVADQTSLDLAARVYALFETWGMPREQARIVLSLVDLRVKFREGEDTDILALLLSEIRRQGYPFFETFLSRSPKIESLYTNREKRALSVLHGAPGSLIHRQLTHLARDVVRALDAERPIAAEAPRVTVPARDVAEPSFDVPPVDAPAAALAPPVADLAEPAFDIPPADSPAAALAPPVADLAEPALDIPPADAPVAALAPVAPARAERRLQPRRPFERRIAGFVLEGPPILALACRDLSPQGLAVEPHAELPQAGRIHVALSAEGRDDPLLVWARLLRSDPDRMALRFELTDDAALADRVARFVASL